MKDLWRRTTELFWEFPILWLPLICADLSAFCLTTSREFAVNQIRTWILTPHSVLGDKLALTVGQAPLFKFAVCTLPLIWGNFILNACIYTAAFVVTASLVRQVLREEKPELPNALKSLGAYPRRILMFSLKLLSIYVLVAIPVFLPATYLMVAVFHRNNVPVFSEAVTLPISILVAWLLAPAGIKLLQSQYSQRISDEAKRNGRILSMIVSGASVVIGCLSLQARHTIVNTADMFGGIQAQMIDASVSLLIAFAYVPLYIALTLLAVEDAQETGLQDTYESDLSIN